MLDDSYYMRYLCAHRYVTKVKAIYPVIVITWEMTSISNGKMSYHSQRAVIGCSITFASAPVLVPPLKN